MPTQVMEIQAVITVSSAHTPISERRGCQGQAGSRDRGFAHPRESTRQSRKWGRVGEDVLPENKSLEIGSRLPAVKTNYNKQKLQQQEGICTVELFISLDRAKNLYNLLS